jgi:hypothetical protein
MVRHHDMAGMFEHAFFLFEDNVLATTMLVGIVY